MNIIASGSEVRSSSRAKETTPLRYLAGAPRFSRASGGCLALLVVTPPTPSTELRAPHPVGNRLGRRTGLPRWTDGRPLRRVLAPGPHRRTAALAQSMAGTCPRAYGSVVPVVRWHAPVLPNWSAWDCGVGIVGRSLPLRQEKAWSNDRTGRRVYGKSSERGGDLLAREQVAEWARLGTERASDLRLAPQERIDRGVEGAELGGARRLLKEDGDQRRFGLS